MPRILVFVFLTCIISFGAEQYQNSLFNVHVERNVVYAENVPHLAKKHFITTLALGLNSPSGEKNNLHFFQNAEETVDGVLNADIYSPKRDSTKKRPLIIVVHGGAFVAGSKDDYKQAANVFCDSLAARGYVVASIDYRKGLVLKNKGYQLFIDSLDVKRAIQWGVQDLQKAIQYFRLNAENYKIDLEKIFVIGGSSGALIALHYLTKEDAKVKAVISLWGATISKDLINKMTVPILLVHGTNDEIIPFKEGRMMNLDSIKEQNQFTHGYASVAVAFNIIFSSPIFYGSYVIDSVLSKHHVAHETYFVENEGHEFCDREPCKTDLLKRIVRFLHKFMD